MVRFNVFLRDGDDVYRTYFLQHGEAVQRIGSVWSLMSLTPYGGQSEEDADGWPQAPQSFWYRRHDEFDDPPPSRAGRGGALPDRARGTVPLWVWIGDGTTTFSF